MHFKGLLNGANFILTAHCAGVVTINNKVSFKWIQMYYGYIYTHTINSCITARRIVDVEYSGVAMVYMPVRQVVSRELSLDRVRILSSG